MSWKNYTEEEQSRFEAQAEAKRPPLLDDAKLLAMAETLFRKGVAAKKTGNFVAAIQNTTGRPLTYHVTVKGERVARQIPTGAWAKVSPAGELNVQVAADGKSTFEALNDVTSRVGSHEAAAEAAQGAGSKVRTTPDALAGALEALAADNPNVDTSRLETGYFAEKNEVLMMRLPCDVRINKPAWGGKPQNMKRGDVLQLTRVGPADVYGNGLAEGTLDTFTFIGNGRNAKQNLHRIPYLPKDKLLTAQLGAEAPKKKRVMALGIGLRL